MVRVLSLVLETLSPQSQRDSCRAHIGLDCISVFVAGIDTLLTLLGTPSKTKTTPRSKATKGETPSKATGKRKKQSEDVDDAEDSSPTKKMAVKAESQEADGLTEEVFN